MTLLLAPISRLIAWAILPCPISRGAKAVAFETSNDTSNNIISLRMLHPPENKGHTSLYKTFPKINHRKILIIFLL
jgi:hypothetical protein